MNIDIRKDKTKKQREAFKNAAHELNERVRNGEKNLVIKLINNIPAVLKDMNNNDSTKNLVNPLSEAKNSSTTKRKADDSNVFDSDNNSANISDKAKKLRNTDIAKN